MGVFHGRQGVQKLDLLKDNLSLLPIFLGLYFKLIKIRSKHKKIKESHNFDSLKLHDGAELYKLNAESLEFCETLRHTAA